MTDTDIIVIVCPKQKLVKIVSRKAKSILKLYRFKEEVPKVKKVVVVEHVDMRAWSIDDKFWSEEKEVMAYDENVMNSIKERTLKIYKQSLLK